MVVVDVGCGVDEVDVFVLVEVVFEVVVVVEADWIFGIHLWI